MPASITGKTQNWFTPNPLMSKTITAGESIKVSKISAIFCTDASGTGIDVKVTLQGFGTPFPIPAGTSLGIDSAVDEISIDTACTLFAMGGK